VSYRITPVNKYSFLLAKNVVTAVVVASKAGLRLHPTLRTRNSELSSCGLAGVAAVRDVANPVCDIVPYEGLGQAFSATARPKK
jgi:hypothetical protein